MNQQEKGISIVLARLPGCSGISNERLKAHPRDMIWPIRLLYGATILRIKGFDVTLVDRYHRFLPVLEMAALIVDSHPAILLMEVTTPDLLYSLDLAREVKRSLPDIKIRDPKSTENPRSGLKLT